MGLTLATALAGLSSGIKVAGGIKGLMEGGVSDSDRRKATAAGVRGQAQGARQAAEKWGFNPLTMLGVSSPLALNGGSAPLASARAISDGFAEAATLFEKPDELDARRNKAEVELLELEVQKQRAGDSRPVVQRTKTADLASPRIASPIVFENERLSPPHQEIYRPARSVGDDDAETEMALGVEMPFDAGDRNTGAAGDWLGEVENLREWWKLGIDQRQGVPHWIDTMVLGGALRRFEPPVDMMKPDKPNRAPLQRPGLNPFTNPGASPF